MNAYTLHDIRIGHDGRTVLTIPELAIPAGAVTALLGENGAGKSTLLHLLALLTAPAHGRLTLFGEAVTARNRARLRKGVSLLLQTPYLFNRSVAGNVAWGLKAHGMGRAERGERVREALAWTGLEKLAERPAHALSGGEAQRLALARLLALRPRVVLLDEPTAHVDAASRARIEAILENWVREHQATVLLATHDAPLAERLGARPLRVADGTTLSGP
ncbi:MAG: ATP-binding cassette domain-containing protein [Nitrospirae bacterium]|nr:ATP-binding cassette domain-containing protein [Nitrospirota bacterium]